MQQDCVNLGYFKLRLMYISQNSCSFNYPRSTSLGCKDIGIRKFVTKTQFLLFKVSVMALCTLMYLGLALIERLVGKLIEKNEEIKEDGS